MTTAPGADRAGVFGGDPTVIGHRGLGCGVVSGHPENTLASFAGAVALGAPWVEVDVRRTADDVLVVAPGDPRHRCLDAPVVARTLSLVHGCGWELLVWCPEPAPARLLAEAGADAVVVDDMAVALGVRHPAA